MMLKDKILFMKNRHFFLEKLTIFYSSGLSSAQRKPTYTFQPEVGAHTIEASNGSE